MIKGIRTIILSLAASLCVPGLIWIIASDALAQGATDGKSLYSVRCAACHDTGLLGAPRLGAAGEWADRITRGRDVLLEHAVKGFNKMPPRGGNPQLKDADIAAAVDYMLSRVEPEKPSSSVTAAGAPEKAAPAPSPVITPVPKAPAAGRGVNAFNRLMKPPSKRNLPPTQDGIHDPENDGTRTLQAPRDSFGILPKSSFGNRVDWVAALDKGDIAPRYDRVDLDVKPIIMDLNIVREVKGSMPDVVYPHKQHTEWLDCSNCHPAIFLPQKGANPMSMAGILLGKQCGVCHGKVAFPVSDCRRCHSGKKASGN